MAIDLAKLDKPDLPGSVIALVTGEHGAGKTTFGATMPAPVFAPLEDGTASLAGMDEVRILPQAANSTEFGHHMGAILKGDHQFRTLVVDSVTALMAMFEEDVMAADRAAGHTPESINQALGGYGAGMRAVENRTEKFCRFCLDLRRKRGMNVVWIGHSIIQTISPPDGAQFDRYGLAGPLKAAAKFVQYADLIGICRLHHVAVQQSQKDKRTVAKGAGYREFVCAPTPSAITKNRFGITDPLRFEATPPNPLLPWINEGE